MARTDQSATPLLTALTLAEKLVERRTTIPILGHVRLIADGKRLTVISTDLDAVIRVMVACDSGPFDTTAPADKLKAVVEYFGGVAGLAVERDKLVVGCANKFHLPTLPVEEFPDIKGPEPVASFDLPAAQLLADLRAVAPAMSNEETRYYLNGVLAHLVGGDLVLAATDGHRLHMVERPMPSGASDLPDTIVPKQVVRLIIDALAASPAVETARCEVGSEKVRFTIGDIEITAKAIDGTYPEYRRVIPTKFVGSLTVSADDLLVIARGVRAIDKDRLMLVLDFGNKVIRADEKHGITFSGPMPGEIGGIPPSVVGANAYYLEGLVEVCAGKDLTIQFDDAASPMLFTIPDDVFGAVLMPMRVK